MIIITAVSQSLQLRLFWGSVQFNNCSSVGIDVPPFHVSLPATSLNHIIKASHGYAFPIPKQSWEYNSFFDSLLLSILCTWPSHLTCLRFFSMRISAIDGSPALQRISTFVILSFLDVFIRCVHYDSYIPHHISMELLHLTLISHWLLHLAFPSKYVVGPALPLYSLINNWQNHLGYEGRVSALQGMFVWTYSGIRKNLQI